MTEQHTKDLMVSGFGQYHTDEPGAKSRVQYLGVTISDIIALIDSPQKTEKKHSQWLIPSSLPTRCFRSQEQHGRFLMMWADLDDSPPTLPDLAESIEVMLSGADYEIYNTSSATISNPKARILIPLRNPLSGADFILAQQILNDRLKVLGIKPDRATERPAQLCYLPNRGEFYGSRSRRQGSLFNPMQTWAAEISAKREAIRAAQVALDTARRTAAERRAALKLSDAPNLISTFNLVYTPQDWLTTAGYDQRGNCFRHPNSQTGNYSATVRRNDNGLLRVNTLSSADPLYTSGSGAHDAFSTFTILMHGGDRRSALKDAGDNLLTIGGQSFNKAVQREWAKKNKAAHAQKMEVI